MGVVGGELVRTGGTAEAEPFVDRRREKGSVFRGLVVRSEEREGLRAEKAFFVEMGELLGELAVERNFLVLRVEGLEKGGGERVEVLARVNWLGEGSGRVGFRGLGRGGVGVGQVVVKRSSGWREEGGVDGSGESGIAPEKRGVRDDVVLRSDELFDGERCWEDAGAGETRDGREGG